MPFLFLLGDSPPNPSGMPTGSALAFVVALGGIIGGAITKTVDILWAGYKERQERKRAEQKDNLEDDRADKKGVVDHQKDLINRLDKDNIDKTARIERLEKKSRRSMGLIVAMRAHMKYLERILKEKKLQFSPYEDPIDPDADEDTPGGSGSETHVPLQLKEHTPENNSGS